MGDIVAFKAGRRFADIRPDGIGAQILWFTGVRYVRIESIDEAVVKQPARPRAKRATLRRRRGSIVGA